jgi:hypothetical protein
MGLVRRFAGTLALGLLLTTPVLGQTLGARGGVSPIQGKGRFSLVVENDLFFKRVPTDRFYTNGIYLHSEWSSPWLRLFAVRLAVPPFRAAKDRSYIGAGLSHELHTPDTINPCGARYRDPLATAENPRQTPFGVCADAEADWRNNYAAHDKPFAAVWSLFLSAQSYFHGQRSQGPFTQYRLWARAEGGSFGSSAGYGYEVQKNWHGFFNDAFVDSDSQAASTPVGWRLGPAKNDPLVQVSGGSDLSLYRLGGDVALYRLGAEIDGRARGLLGFPRNLFGLGATLRAGLLPQHSSEPVAAPGAYQPSSAYLEASLDTSAVLTDYTNGELGNYRRFLDEYALGLALKLLGVAVGASVHWQRILYRDPLRPYPSREPISDRYHRYGRVALEFTY